MKKLLFGLLLVGSAGLLSATTKQFFDDMEEGHYKAALNVVGSVNVHAVSKEEGFEITPLAYVVVETVEADEADMKTLIKLAKKLIKKGANINWAEKDGHSILMLAVNHYMPLEQGSKIGHDGYTDSSKMIHFLVKNGADPYHKNNQGKTLFDDLKNRSGDSDQLKAYNKLIHWIKQNASSKKDA